MTLNQLNYFVATCNNGQNMTNAAKSLFVTQSAISCAIKDLEEEFQLQLFVRGKKNLYLTDEGKKFYQLAAQVLEAADKLTAAFSREEREVPPLRVGLTALTGSLFSQVLERFQADRPEPPLRLSLFQAPKLRELLRQGFLDVVITGWDDRDSKPGYQHQVLGCGRCVLYIRRDHPLAGLSEVPPLQLAQLPVCYYFDSEELISSPDAPRILEQYVPGLQLRNVQMETTFLSSVHEFVAEGRGGAILAGGVRFEDDDIRQIPIQGASPFRIAALWRQGSDLPPAARALLQTVRDSLLKEE